MIKDKNKGHTREFKSDDPTTYLTNVEQQKNMLLDLVDDAKAKPKKKAMVPIEIPEILSVPRYPRDMSHTSFGRLGHIPTRHISTNVIGKHYTAPTESYNKRPQTPVGLSQRFTQDRLREGQILKQLDREMVSERKNSSVTTKEEND